MKKQSRQSKSKVTRVDPTRTTRLRNLFAADIKRRFRTIAAVISRVVGQQDYFNLNPRGILPFMAKNSTGGSFVFNAGPFTTDPEKLKAFQDWIQEQIRQGLLSLPADFRGDPSKPWTSKYIDSAYRRGLINAYAAARFGKDADNLETEGGRQAEFLRSAFASSERLSKIQFVATRTYGDLKGVGDYAGTQMNRFMAEAIANGYGAGKTAKGLRDILTGKPAYRAELVARTEIIAAHAQGQLDAFKEMGIAELGVQAEWMTAGDSRVCERCAAMEGRKFTVEEAQGLIPLHPLCRCTWIPHTGPLPRKRK